MTVLFRGILVLLISAIYVVARVPTESSRQDAELYGLSDASNLNTSKHELRRREDIYQEALNKGTSLLVKLMQARPLSQQSPWSMEEQLSDNGWTIASERLMQVNDYAGPNSKLGIDPRYGTGITVVQDAYFDLCHAKNVVCPLVTFLRASLQSSTKTADFDQAPTFGSFRQIYNWQYRAIIGTDNFSPLHEVKIKHHGATDAQLRNTILPNSLPNLRQWSDVTFIVWSERAGKQIPLPKAVNSLKYIFTNQVTTKETKEVMGEALSHVTDLRMPPWPGIYFPLGKEEMRALMGTPHGKGVAYLLLDHPVGMGSRKNVESIHMFATSGQMYNLLFTLTD